MTMFALPSVTTSASATPRPFTRCSMIWRASSRSSWDGALPSGVSAFSVTVVPPRRSRPSCGVRLAPVKKTSAYRPARSSTSTAKYRRADNDRLATGSLRSAGAVGRTPVGAVLTRQLRLRRGGGELTGRRAGLEDRLLDEGHDDAGRDLQVDGALALPDDGPVHAAGGHHRGAGREGVPQGLLLLRHLLALPGREHEEQECRHDEQDEREILLQHDWDASLPRSVAAVGAPPRFGDARVRPVVRLTIDTAR